MTLASSSSSGTPRLRQVSRLVAVTTAGLVIAPAFATAAAATPSHATETAAAAASSANVSPRHLTKGQQLVRGQWVQMATKKLFVANTRHLSRRGATSLRRLDRSLRIATSLTCEGYVHHGHHTKRELHLAHARAVVACRALHAGRPSVHTKAFGYVSKHHTNRLVIRVVRSVAAPSAPHLTKITAGIASATLTFTSPRHLGGAPVTAYQESTDGGVTWKMITTTTASPHTSTVVGLTNGTTYSFRVRALNKAGSSKASNARRVTPRGGVIRLHIVPSAPSITSVDPGDGTATLTFSPPVSSGNAPISGYEVSTDGGTSWSALAISGSDPLVGTVSGLTDDTTYVVAVRADNANGHSLASNWISVTPVATASAPAAPSLTAASPGDGTATLTFTPPTSNGGSAITGYEASIDGGNHWQTITVSGTTSLTATVSGLADDTTYSVAVRADNEVGPSPASNLLSVTPEAAATTADAPVLEQVSPGDQTATLTFSAPDSDGGSAITGYDVTTNGGTTWMAVTVSGTNPMTTTLTGLTNGTTYTVAVRADNAVGASTASNAMSVTPVASATAPDAPSLTEVDPGDSSATVTFDKPASDGGSGVTGYEASVDGGDTWSPIAATGSGPLTATITGLSNGTTYTVAVRADNAVGDSAASNTMDVTPAAAETTASAPRDTEANPGNDQATMDFMIPASNGGSTITGYVATLDGGTTWFPVSPTGIMNMSFTVYGLTNGVTYEMAVRAVTAAGYGAMSPIIDVTPEASAVVPGAPTLTSVSGLLGLLGNVAATATFSAPTNDGGSTVIGYEISVDGGSSWTPTLALGLNPFTSLSITLSTGTTYHFAVRAENVVGYGPASNIVTYTPSLSL